LEAERDEPEGGEVVESSDEQLKIEEAVWHKED
jgi:hypothetical protein